MKKLSLPPTELERYVLALVAHHFPDGYRPTYPLSDLVEKALKRTLFSFSHIHRKYYREAGVTCFDHLMGDHFTVFLYFLGNTIWRETGDTALPIRLFYLNKVLHGIDLFYSIAMPDIFMVVHPLGTVLGNARYGNYLVVYQNVTVGADEAGIYPSFGEGTVLYAKSTVIGACTLGNNVVLAANAMLLNRDAPANSVVVGQYPNHRLLPSRESVWQRVFADRSTTEAPNAT